MLISLILSLIVLLQSIVLSLSQSTSQVPTWDLQSFTHDGRNNPFIYPQITAITSNQTILVYHYGVDGVSGQSGITFISDQGQFIKSLTNITGPAPCSFFYDRQVAMLPYPANYMRVVQVIDQSTNQMREQIEMTIPCLIVTETQTRSEMTNMVIDLNGAYIGTFATRRPSLIPYQSTNANVTKDPRTKSIVIGEPINRSISLYDYWQFTGGKTDFASDPVVIMINQRTVIAVMVDDTSQSSPLVSQTILMIDWMNGEVVGLIDHLHYDAGQIFQSTLYQLTVNQLNDQTHPQRIILRTPDRNLGAENEPSTVYVYTINQSTLQPRPSILPGQVTNVWYANYGALIGQAAFTQNDGQSVICSSTMTVRNNIKLTGEIICFNLETRRTINRFNQIRQLSAAAISLGASPNITDYLIISMTGRTVNGQDQLFLSFLSPSFDQPFGSPVVGVPSSGVLIIDRTGLFIDYYDEFQLPQTVFFSLNIDPTTNQSTEMIVPDRWSNSLSVIDLTSRQVVRTVTCTGCLGGAINHGASGGYVIASTTSSPYGGQLRFYRDTWVLNSALRTISLPTSSLSSTSSTGPISNPLTDRAGRIYVLVNSAGGQGRATAVMRVFNGTTSNLIAEHNFANPQPRGSTGVAQFPYCSSLTMAPADQSIVVTTNDFGQVFRTRTYVSELIVPVSSSSSSSSTAAPVQSSSSSSTGGFVSSSVERSSSSSSTTSPTSSPMVVPTSSPDVNPTSSPVASSSSSVVSPSSTASAQSSSSAINPILSSALSSSIPSSSAAQSSSDRSSSGVSSSSSPVISSSVDPSSTGSSSSSSLIPSVSSSHIIVSSSSVSPASSSAFSSSAVSSSAISSSAISSSAISSSVISSSAISSSAISASAISSSAISSSAISSSAISSSAISSSAISSSAFISSALSSSALSSSAISSSAISSSAISSSAISSSAISSSAISSSAISSSAISSSAISSSAIGSSAGSQTSSIGDSQSSSQTSVRSSSAVLSSSGSLSSSTAAASSSVRSSSTAATASSSSTASVTSSAAGSSSMRQSSSSSSIAQSSSTAPISPSSLSSSARLPSSSSGFSSIFTSLSSAATGTSAPVIPSSSTSTSPLSSTGADRTSSSGVESSSSTVMASSSSTGDAQTVQLSSSSSASGVAESSSSTGLAIVDDGSSSSSLSNGELAAAIVVPVFVVLACIIAALLWFCRPTGAKADPKASNAAPTVVPEADTTVDDHSVHVEMV